MALSSELTPADIAACTGNNGGFGDGNGAWWLLILFLFAMNGGWNNGGGAANNYVLNSDFATLQRQLSDGFGSQERRTDSIINGLSNIGYTQQTLTNGTNTSMLQGFNQIQSQLAQCCCDNRMATAETQRQMERGFADTNYNMATQNCATLQAIDKVGDRVIDYFTQDRIQSLRDENAELKLSASQAVQNQYLINELRPCPTPAYIVSNPYSYNSCGC